MSERRDSATFNMGNLTPADLQRVQAEAAARGYVVANNGLPVNVRARQLARDFLNFVEAVTPILCIDPKTRRGSVNVDNLPDLEEVKKQIWNKQAESWGRVETPTVYQTTMEILLEFLKTSPKKGRERIASLGSGPGFYETYLGYILNGREFPSTIQVTAIDYAEEMTNFHRKLLASVLLDKKKVGNVEPVTGDMTRLTYPDNYFDQIFCNNSLQWSSDWRKAISEMARVMSPKGLARLYLFVNNHPMVMENLTLGKTIEVGSIDIADLLDTLEANHFSLRRVRQFTTIEGLGQRGGKADRVFIFGEYTPKGRIKSWREANAQAVMRTEY